MNARYKNRGFTLIELLVVIAIIAILAAILFPVFAQARESARTTSCLSNEKQVILGILQYVQDYDERFPIFYYSWPDGSHGVDPDGGGYINDGLGWDEACDPYEKNRGVFHCPDMYGPGNDWTNPAKDDTDWDGTLNYAINCRLSGRGYNDTWESGDKLASVNWPAMAILLSEDGTQTAEGACRADSGAEWGWTTDQKAALIVEGGDGTFPGPLAIHKGGSNYGFVDGHAKWYNANAMGLQGTCIDTNGTITGCQATDQSVLGAGLDYTGNHPTYHINAND